MIVVMERKLRVTGKFVDERCKPIALEQSQYCKTETAKDTHQRIIELTLEFGVFRHDKDWLCNRATGLPPGNKVLQKLLHFIRDRDDSASNFALPCCLTFQARPWNIALLQGFGIAYVGDRPG